MMNLFGLENHAAKVKLWSDPFHVRLTALQRCINREENPKKRAFLLRALARVKTERGLNRIKNLLTSKESVINGE